MIPETLIIEDDTFPESGELDGYGYDPFPEYRRELERERGRDGYSTSDCEGGERE